MYHTAGKEGLLGVPNCGVSTQRLPEKHRSGISPTSSESVTHEKSVRLQLLELHRVTPFSSEAGADSLRSR